MYPLVPDTHCNEDERGDADGGSDGGGPLEMERFTPGLFSGRIALGVLAALSEGPSASKHVDNVLYGRSISPVQSTGSFLHIVRVKYHRSSMKDSQHMREVGGRFNSFSNPFSRLYQRIFFRSTQRRL